MTQTLLVINPNSTQAVTDAMATALDPLRFADGPRIECVTLTAGPPGIESQQHADAVIPPLCELIRQRDDASGYVIACYSDPGLYSAREITTKPVLGIAAGAMATATVIGERFGVISILERSIARHQRYVRLLGLQDRLAGDRAIGLGVVELQDRERVLERMIRVGQALRDQDGAEVLILGCAGMAQYRQPLMEALAMPVVDPSFATVTLALGLLRQANPPSPAPTDPRIPGGV